MGTEAANDLGARITGATSDLASRVTSALRNAAQATGAGFDYLLNTAARESNFDPNAKSPNSSATGLFQFLDQTWLGTLKTAGPNLGYGRYADAITQTASGSYAVTDPAMQREILALRKDPTAAAMMGGALANANARTLTENLGRKPTDGELYIAHFLGPGGAVQLIRGAQTTPNATAATMFPRAAAANGPVFYDKAGNARSLREVYNFIVARHDVGGARLATGTVAPVAASATTMTSAATTRAPVPAAPPLILSNVQATAPAQARTAAPTGAYTVEVNAPIAQRATGPMFHGLYSDGNRGAVAPVVRELWGVRHGMPAQTEGAVAPATAASGTPQTQPPANFFQSLRQPGSG